MPRSTTHGVEQHRPLGDHIGCVRCGITYEEEEQVDGECPVCDELGWV